MTIEKKKISLINWIMNLDDEAVIVKIEGFRKSSLEELPKEIVELLTYQSLDECVEHTNSRDILNRK